MRIVFKRIEMSNFMSFEDEVFDFAAQDGMTLVQGINNDFPGQKNGSGKTSSFLSLLYVLFGEIPTSQTKMKNENIINRQSKTKDMRLVLWLDVDQKKFKIARGISKKATSLNVFELEDDGAEKDITKSSIAETQEMLEKDILHCDISIFLRTILLTADQTYNFYLLKKADKKEFVEKLFDISVFEDMWKLIHRDILDLGKDILAKQNFLLGISKKIDDYSDKAKIYEAEHAKKLEILAESVERAETELASQKKAEVKTNGNAVKKLEDALEKLDEKKAEAARKESEIIQKMTKCDLGIHKLESTKSSNEKTVAKHAEVLKQLCTDCQKVFKNYYSLDSCMQEIAGAEEKISKLKAAKRSLQAEKDSFSLERAGDDEKIQKIRAKLREMNAKAIESRSAIARLESRAESLREELVEARRSKNPWTEMLESSRAEIKEKSDELDSLNLKSKKLELAESIVSQETLRKFIIKDLIVLLNNKIKTYLTKLGAGFYVVFDEDMDYEFVTPTGRCEWGNFSAGERMKTMVATSFAFRDFMSVRNGLNSNILVLDEYFDSAIDDMTVESVLGMLKEMSRSNNQSIYVITHRKEVTPDMFEHLMTVEKTGGISHISVK